MNKEKKLGMNRTGIDTSPIDSKQMVANVEKLTKVPPGGPETVAEDHIRYIVEAEPVGSVPPPASLKGAVKTGLQMLEGHDPKLLLDKLGERLAFERTGVRLYDALIAKYDASAKAKSVVSLAKIEDIRAEEWEHFMLLSNTIRQLGADPTAMTPAADVTGVASSGIAKVLGEPRIGFVDSLEAILIAELADNDSWELLIKLTEKAGLRETANQFREALEDEREHLMTVRQWIQQFNLGGAEAAKKIA